MAITKMVKLNTGLPDVPNAYIRIDTVVGNKSNITVDVNTYASKESFNNSMAYIKPSEQFTFVPSVEDNSPNFIKQGYEYLKTLTEFQDAVDA